MKWAALATLHASMGCSFMSWTGPKPRPLVARRVAENMNMDTNVAAEVQAILDELRLDEWAEPQRMVESGAEVPSGWGAPPMPQTALTKTPSSWGRSRSLSQLQTKRGQLEAELRQQELQQQLHQLELQERRLQTQTEGWSARPPLPSSVMRRSASGGTAAEDSELSPLVQALRHWGIRPVPELGPDMFGASIAQLKMLVRARDDQGRHHVAAVQALQRYVTQLESDLDSKDDELAAAKRNLEEVQRHGFEPVEPEEVSAEVAELKEQLASTVKAQEEAQRQLEVERAEAAETARANQAGFEEAAQAEVLELKEQLASAMKGQEEAQQQLQLQVERAEAAEAKLVTLVERIRGAATAKKATEGVASASEEVPES